MPAVVFMILLLLCPATAVRGDPTPVSSSITIDTQVAVGMTTSAGDDSDSQLATIAPLSASAVASLAGATLSNTLTADWTSPSAGSVSFDADGHLFVPASSWTVFERSVTIEFDSDVAGLLTLSYIGGTSFVLNGTTVNEGGVLINATFNGVPVTLTTDDDTETGVTVLDAIAGTNLLVLDFGTGTATQIAITTEGFGSYDLDWTFTPTEFIPAVSTLGQRITFVALGLVSWAFLAGARSSRRRR